MKPIITATYKTWLEEGYDLDGDEFFCIKSGLKQLSFSDSEPQPDVQHQAASIINGACVIPVTAENVHVTCVSVCVFVCGLVLHWNIS